MICSMHRRALLEAPRCAALASHPAYPESRQLAVPRPMSINADNPGVESVGPGL